MCDLVTRRLGVSKCGRGVATMRAYFFRWMEKKYISYICPSRSLETEVHYGPALHSLKAEFDEGSRDIEAVACQTLELAANCLDSGRSNKPSPRSWLECIGEVKAFIEELEWHMTSSDESRDGYSCGEFGYEGDHF